MYKQYGMIPSHLRSPSLPSGKIPLPFTGKGMRQMTLTSSVGKCLFPLLNRPFTPKRHFRNLNCFFIARGIRPGRRRKLLTLPGIAGNFRTATHGNPDISSRKRKTADGFHHRRVIRLIIPSLSSPAPSRKICPSGLSFFKANFLRDNRHFRIEQSCFSRKQDIWLIVCNWEMHSTGHEVKVAGVNKTDAISIWDGGSSWITKPDIYRSRNYFLGNAKYSYLLRWIQVAGYRGGSEPEDHEFQRWFCNYHKGGSLISIIIYG